MPEFEYDWVEAFALKPHGIPESTFNLIFNNAKTPDELASGFRIWMDEYEL